MANSVGQRPLRRSAAPERGPGVARALVIGIRDGTRHGIRLSVGLGLGVGLSVGLIGCTAAGVSPGATGSASAAPSRPTPDAAAAPTTVPVLLPDAGAADNLAYFDTLAGAVASADAAAGGRAFIDALAAGGFAKSEMELTPDKTSADLDADSIEFSVRFKGECLIGQHGPATDGYHGVVAPLLSTGRCLIGATRQIDW